MGYSPQQSVLVRIGRGRGAGGDADTDLVLVDLTEHNANVFFDLGVRMAMDHKAARSPRPPVGVLPCWRQRTTSTAQRPERSVSLSAADAIRDTLCACTKQAVSGTDENAPPHERQQIPFDLE
jgi:hypothetical protein